MSREIKVLDYAKGHIAPNKIKLTFSNITQDRSYSNAMAINNANFEKLKDVLVDMGLSVGELKSDSFYVEDRMYENNRESKGYKIVGLYSYVLGLGDNLPHLIINRIAADDINIMVKAMCFSDELEQLSNELIVKAIESATKKAEIIAEASNVKLGKIAKIDYSTPNNAGHYGMRAMNSSETINAQDIEITERVEIEWTIV